MRPLTIVESPFAGDSERNIQYARLCCRHTYDRGEHPFASHLLYPRFMNDNLPDERRDGIAFGYFFWQLADKIAFYTDYGWSNGMMGSLKIAVAGNRPVFIRSVELRGNVRTPEMEHDWLTLAIRNGFVFQID